MAFLLYINILEGGGWWCGTEGKKGAWAAIVMRMEQYTKGKGLIGLGARGVSSGCNIGWQSRRDWGTALFTTQEIYLLMRWSSLLPLMFFVITLSWIAVTVECMQDEQRRLVNATSLRLKWTLIAFELGIGDRQSLINFFFDCLYLNTIARIVWLLVTLRRDVAAFDVIQNGGRLPRKFVLFGCCVDKRKSWRLRLFFSTFVEFFQK